MKINGNWINGDKYKLHLKQKPYTRMALSVVGNLFFFFVFYYLWTNSRWVIWLLTMIVWICAGTDVMSSGILNYYPKVKAATSY